MSDHPTPDEQRVQRLTSALAETAPNNHGPFLIRLAEKVVDELPPTLCEDLLGVLETPARRQRLLEQRLRDERYRPADTTTVEGLTRDANERAAVLEDLAARREARR